MIRTATEYREIQRRLASIDREVRSLEMSMIAQGTPVETRVSILQDLRAARAELAREAESYERHRHGEEAS